MLDMNDIPELLEFSCRSEHKAPAPGCTAKCRGDPSISCGGPGGPQGSAISIMKIVSICVSELLEYNTVLHTRSVPVIYTVVRIVWSIALGMWVCGRWLGIFGDCIVFGGWFFVYWWWHRLECQGAWQARTGCTSTSGKIAPHS